MNQKEFVVMTSFDPILFYAIKGFIDPKVAKEVEENKEKIIAALENPTHTLGYYIKSLAEKMGWDFEKMDKFLCDLADINPGAAFQVILKEIAIELDKKYPDHIKNSKELYGIATISGRICKINKSSIRSYKNFSGFRTIEDARFACKITRKILKYMFNSGK